MATGVLDVEFWIVFKYWNPTVSRTLKRMRLHVNGYRIVCAWCYRFVLIIFHSHTWESTHHEEVQEGPAIHSNKQEVICIPLLLLLIRMHQLVLSLKWWLLCILMNSGKSKHSYWWEELGKEELSDRFHIHIAPRWVAAREREQFYRNLTESG